MLTLADIGATENCSCKLCIYCVSAYIYIQVPLCIDGSPNDSWRVPAPIFWDFAGSRYCSYALTPFATDLMTLLLEIFLSWCHTRFHSTSVLSKLPLGITRSHTAWVTGSWRGPTRGIRTPALLTRATVSRN